MKKYLLFAMLGAWWVNGYSQDSVAVKGGFWKEGWFVQMGTDMTLQNPYNYQFSESFSNGRSYGIDIALGKRVTQELGFRGKVNWENGLVKSKADWLAPFFQPGENHRKGGYLSVTGDIMLDVMSVFAREPKERRFAVDVFPRAGVIYNFGVSKGSPLLGFGLDGRYRLSDRVTLYAELAYNMVSSGFTGHESTSTGTGTGANGFMNLEAGVQIALAKTSFARKLENKKTRKQEEIQKRVLERSGYYLQMGWDMSLMTPYGCDFAQSFTKGRTMGVALAVGKWLTPEVGLMVRGKWENGIGLFRNNDLEWMSPVGKPNENMDKGGYVYGVMDLNLSLSNIFAEPDFERKTNVYVFPRAGIISNLATDSASPMVGAGVGVTYRIGKKWSIYTDAAYQVSTSEFIGEMTTGMSVSTGCNGFLDWHVGVQYDL